MLATGAIANSKALIFLKIEELDSFGNKSM